MGRRADLSDLCAALAGRPRREADWLGVMTLANAALVTPQVHGAALAAGRTQDLPDEVSGFTAEVHKRNRERNRRLFEQLTEAVGVLNAAGVEPVLLKGAALWMTTGGAATSDRMLNDLDLLVRPADAARAIEALKAADFNLAAAYDGPEVHVVAEFGRPQDVGFLDLHQRPPGPPGLAEIPDLHQASRVVDWNGVRARVPDPDIQLFLLVLHDQFHDGDYWGGDFTLRHLLDIAELSRAGIDWDRVRHLARTRLVANALDAQLIAAHRLVGAELPAEVLRRPWARLQYARHMAQFCWPSFAAPLAALGVASEWLSLIRHHRANVDDRRRLFGDERARTGGLAHRLSRARHILGGFAAGKV